MSEDDRTNESGDDGEKPASDGDREKPASDGDREGPADTEPDIETDPFDEIDELADGEPVDDPFTEMEVEDIDEDDVWSEVTEEANGDSGSDTEALGDDETPLEETVIGADDVPTDADEAIVEKRSYCQRCEFFAEPPDVACTNEGTEIVELLDTERFRVRNCPVVERRRGTAEEVLKD